MVCAQGPVTLTTALLDVPVPAGAVHIAVTALLGPLTGGMGGPFIKVQWTVLSRVDSTVIEYWPSAISVILPSTTCLMVLRA